MNEVLFIGSDATIYLQKILQLIRTLHDDSQVLVLVGPYEDSINLKFWRESGFRVIMIPDSEQAIAVVSEAHGMIDTVVIFVYVICQ